MRIVSSFGEQLCDLVKEGRLHLIEEIAVGLNSNDLEWNCSDGDTPLMLAIKKGYIDLVKLLVTAGANVNVKNQLGETPLVLALQHKRHGEGMAGILLEAPDIDVNVCDLQGNPAILLLPWHADNLLQIFLKRNTQLKVADERTPLACPDFNAHALLNLLFSAGKFGQAKITLQYMVENPKEYSLDVEAKNSEGANLLGACIYYGCTDIQIVQMLLGLGVKVSDRNKAGKSPLDYALTRRDYSVALMLINSGALEKVSQRRISKYWKIILHEDTDLVELSKALAEKQVACFSYNFDIMIDLLTIPIELDHFKSFVMLLNIFLPLLPDFWDQSKLLYSATVAGCKYLEVLFEKFPNLNPNIMYDDGDTTPLVLAVERGDLEAVKFLINKNASKDHKTSDELITPLMAAVKNEHVAVVEYLLKYDVMGKLTETIDSFDIDAQDKYGRTALFMACEDGYIELATLLLDCGADPTIADFTEEMNPLMCAANHGAQQLVEKIIRKLKDMDLDIKEEINKAVHSAFGSSTALIFAAQKGHVNIVNMLLDNKADVWIQDINGNNAFHHAVSKGHVKLVEYLQFMFPNIIDVGDDGKAELLQLACSANFKAYEIIRDKIIDPKVFTQPNGCGSTPLMLAALKGNLEIVKDLLDKQLREKANPYILDALQYACKGGHAKVIEYLLNLYPELKDARALNSTAKPLMLAVKSGNLAAVKLLLENGADVNMIQNETGQTALHMTCTLHGCEIAQELIKHGADVTITDNFNLRPFDIALYSANVKLTKYFWQELNDVLNPNGLAIRFDDGIGEVFLHLSRFHHLDNHNQDRLLKYFNFGSRLFRLRGPSLAKELFTIVNVYFADSINVILKELCYNTSSIPGDGAKFLFWQALFVHVANYIERMATRQRNRNRMDVTQPVESLLDTMVKIILFCADSRNIPYALEEFKQIATDFAANDIFTGLPELVSGEQQFRFINRISTLYPFMTEYLFQYDPITWLEFINCGRKTFYSATRMDSSRLKQLGRGK